MASPATRAAHLGVRSLRRRRISHVNPASPVSNSAPARPSLVQGLSSRRPTPPVSVIAPSNIAPASTSSHQLLQHGEDFDEVKAYEINGFTKLNYNRSTGLNAFSKLNGTSNKNKNINDKYGAQTNYSLGDAKLAVQMEQKRTFESDLIVVLDMDECMIHSQFMSQQAPTNTFFKKSTTKDNYRQSESRPDHSTSATSAFLTDGFEVESLLPGGGLCESFRVSLSNGDTVHVNKRPNLDTFLKDITSKYETYVFTAAVELYAGPVLDKLDPTGDMFQGRFFREHCEFDSDMNAFVKNLNNIDVEKSNEETSVRASSSSLSSSFEGKRVVLVDNNPLSFLANPSNGILVSNFYDDPKDDTLLAVTELLKELEGVEDVRPFLDKKFGLCDALKDVVRGGGWR